MADDDDVYNTTDELLVNIKEFMEFPQYKDYGFFQLGNSNYGLARKKNLTNYIETNFVVLGNVDSGKSTTIGVLITGRKDDGKGLARLNAFNYPHERETGRTSSVSRHILGYDENNNSINTEVYKNTKKLVELTDWPSIIKHTKKLVVLSDLCGHEKYLKTTIKGVLGTNADYGIVIIAANDGVNKMTKEHMTILNSSRIPFIIIITKIDITPDNVYQDTIIQIRSLLTGKVKKRNLYKIKALDDMAMLITNPDVIGNRYIPIIEVSNVEEKNINLLRHVIGLLPKRLNMKNIYDN